MLLLEEAESSTEKEKEKEAPTGVRSTSRCRHHQRSDPLPITVLHRATRRRPDHYSPEFEPSGKLLKRLGRQESLADKIYQF